MKSLITFLSLLVSLSAIAGDQYLVCRDANDINGDSEFLADVYIDDRAEANFKFNNVSYDVMADISGDEMPRLHVVEKLSDNSINVKMFDVPSGQMIKISNDVECGILD